MAAGRVKVNFLQDSSPGVIKKSFNEEYTTLGITHVRPDLEKINGLRWWVNMIKIHSMKFSRKKQKYFEVYPLNYIKEYTLYRDLSLHKFNEFYYLICLCQHCELTHRAYLICH